MTQPLDPDERAFLDLCCLDEPGWRDMPGYHSGLGATGLPWPATRRPAYRDWPDTITDLHLPEETP